MKTVFPETRATIIALLLITCVCFALPEQAPVRSLAPSMSDTEYELMKREHVSPLDSGDHIPLRDTLEVFGSLTDQYSDNVKYAIENIESAVPDFHRVPKPYLWLSSPTFWGEDRDLNGFYQNRTIAINPEIQGTVSERATYYHEWAHHYIATMPRLERFRTAITSLAYETEAVKETQRQTERSPNGNTIAQYYLSGEELFARAMAQYIALKSDDTGALDLLYSRYPHQWRERDFRRLEVLLDAILGNY